MVKINPERRRLRLLRTMASALLIITIAGILISAYFGDTGGWAWFMAFCKAAAIGALADWFAVTAMFRRPLGLPIPHSDVLARRKQDIGNGLAEFISRHFLQPDQLAQKLHEQAFITRFTEKMEMPGAANHMAHRICFYASTLFDVLNGSQLEAFIAEMFNSALDRIDTGKLAGNWLDLLTYKERHYEVFDEFLNWLADLLGEEAVKGLIFRNILSSIENKSRWWRALNRIGIADLVSREITKNLPAMIKQLQDDLRDPTHPNRLAFDQWLNNAVDRLKNDVETQIWLQKRLHAFTSSREFRSYLNMVGHDVRGWLNADLRCEDSLLARWIESGIKIITRRIQVDSSLHEELESQIGRLAITLAPAVDNFIHQHIQQTIYHWNERELIATLELAVGPDLQYIRFNGTLVGGLIGLLLHALVVFGLPFIS